jgi:cullin-associated NEDD8-dissociated protein 1
MTCDEAIYTKIIDMLSKGLKSSGKDRKASEVLAHTNTCIQAIGIICKQAGHRFRDHVNKIVPLIFKHASKEDEELREQCLQAFESIVSKCGKEASSHISDIIKICLEYIAYDPNYNYDEDEDDPMECAEDSEEEDDQDVDYSDNEDISWKVRKAAARCLQALISARPDLLQQFYSFSPNLIKRFKERETIVKGEILHTYITLLKQTKLVLQDMPNTVNSSKTFQSSSGMEIDTPINEALLSQVPFLLKALRKLMKDNNERVKLDCFQLLSQMVDVTPNILGSHISEVVPWVQNAFLTKEASSNKEKEASSNIKIGVLTFLQRVIHSHNNDSSRHLILPFLPAIIRGVSDTFYKISSEALLIMTNLVRALGPAELVKKEIKLNMKNYGQEMYRVCLDEIAKKESERQTMMKVKGVKLDEHTQEVENRAITCMGHIIASFGSLLVDQIPNCLRMLTNLLQNDRTRLVTVRAFITVVKASSRIQISAPTIESIMELLKSFLQGPSRDLKVSALQLLSELVCKHTSTDKHMKQLSVVLPSLIRESDLQIAQLAIDAFCAIARKHASAILSMAKSEFEPIFSLTHSSVLQGGALTSLCKLLPALVAAKIPGLGYKEAVDKLTNPTMSPQFKGEAQQRHVQVSIATCIASIVIAQPSKDVQSFVRKNLSTLNENRSTAAMLTYSLFCIAEVGKRSDLSSISMLKTAILEKLTHASEDVKSAASYALGGISVGNLGHYLPYILQQIENQNSQAYLLLHSLKEVITMAAGSASDTFFASCVEKIWSQLLLNSESNEEGTRNIVAECLGKLCLIEPKQLLKLEGLLESTSPLKRSTALTAIKFIIIDEPHPIDSLLGRELHKFLLYVKDDDLNVKKMALVAFNSAAHNKPLLIKNLLCDLLPHLYKETEKRAELIRIVEMGPFKHEVDDGLDLRKTAFECMYTLLDRCFDQLDLFKYLKHLEGGLKDHNDIKMLAYLMVSCLAKRCPIQVLTNIESLTDALNSTLKIKLKSNALKQEQEKLDEVKKSAVRTIAVLVAIPEAKQNSKVNEVITYINNTAQLKEFYDAAQQDSNNNAVGKENSDNDMDVN